MTPIPIDLVYHTHSEEDSRVVWQDSEYIRQKHFNHRFFFWFWST